MLGWHGCLGGMSAWGHECLGGMSAWGHECLDGMGIWVVWVFGWYGCLKCSLGRGDCVSSCRYCRFVSKLCPTFH